MQSVRDLLAGVPIQQFIGSEDEAVKALCNDSRFAQAQSCFVAITGHQVDGHSYIEEAIKREVR